jgi:hypothetical protein
MSGARPLIGWYVHHAGAGHLTRFRAVRPHLDADVVVFSSAPRPPALPPATRWVALARDDDPIPVEGGSRMPADADPTARGLLHWAPLGHPGHTDRLAAIAASIGAESYAAFVVDVSVEVALLVRLLGVPPVLFAQPGARLDGPHALGYAAAERIIAPWAEGVHVAPALEAVADRVRTVGAISRFDGRARAGARRPGTVLFLGGGEAGDAGALVRAAAAATDGWSWTMLGGVRADAAGSVISTGWVDDPWPHLCRAEVVVSWTGQNAVADLAAVDARAVVVPQPRPFDEQAATGDALAAAGLAVRLSAWPEPSAWPDVLAEARASAPVWSRWRTGGAAARAAAAIAEVAV